MGEDIRKQLPKETAEFDGVNSNWKVIDLAVCVQSYLMSLSIQIVMSRLNKDPNALRGTHHEGLLELLNEMNGILEAIQRSLDMYLETKRQCFPRFYFLSNDDLLEILGQSKNPEAVSGNLTKYAICYTNTVTIPAYCQV